MKPYGHSRRDKLECSLEKRRELIELLDQAIALGVELNQQLSSIGHIMASTEVGSIGRRFDPYLTSQ